MHALGRVFDLGITIPPAATNGAVTGKRIHLKAGTSCTFVLIGGVASAGDDVQLDVQQHTAYTGGTSGDLDVITEYFYKSAVAMDNTETWTRVTQAAASEVAIAASATTDIQQNLVVVEVDAAMLTDGYEWVSVNVPDLGAGDKTLTVLAIVTELAVQRRPSNLANLNA